MTAFAFLTVTVYTINLAAQSKLEKKEEEERTLLEERLEEYEKRIDYLYDYLNIVTDGEGEIVVEG